MHPEAYQWVQKWATDDAVTVLDIGGRNINGTTRDLFPNSTYTALDIRPGDGVDIVANAAEWDPATQRWDVVVCTEVFEHTAEWPQICATAFRALRPGGRFVATMAGPGRPVHSAVDGGPFLHPGEHYGNVDPAALGFVLGRTGFQAVTVDVQQNPNDVRCVATKPE